MIPQELEERIGRLFHTEHWPVCTIARELHVHHSVVSRVLGAPSGRNAYAMRRSKIDPFLPFVRETLERYPRIRASRVYGMMKERGYVGCESHVRRVIRSIRPRRKAEAFLRLRTLPAEQAQVDWAHFGHVTIGKAKRPLMAFVMVLSYSRAVYLRFFLGAKQAEFLKGHVEAFSFFEGCARVVLYDNLKSAVLERKGDAIRFHPGILAFAAHYHFEPRPVAVARGNEKGRVERMIRTIRDAFFAGRKWSNLEDLNAQALAWCEKDALERPFVEDRTERVLDAFLREKKTLLPLPDNPFCVEQRDEVTIGKTPYARFDLNDYSVPHDCVRRVLMVVADEQRVRIVDGMRIVAEHPRSFDRGQRIEDPSHISALIEEKKNARAHRGVDRLSIAVPIAIVLLEKIAQRGLPLEGATRRLEQMLDTFGAKELSTAIEEVIASGAHHPTAVYHVLDRRRDQRGAAPAMPLLLPNDPKFDGVVRPASLDPYSDLELRADPHGEATPLSPPPAKKEVPHDESGPLPF
jgi:transposase